MEKYKYFSTSNGSIPCLLFVFVFQLIVVAILFVLSRLVPAGTVFFGSMLSLIALGICTAHYERELKRLKALLREYKEDDEAARYRLINILSSSRQDNQDFSGMLTKHLAAKIRERFSELGEQNDMLNKARRVLEDMFSLVDGYDDGHLNLPVFTTEELAMMLKYHWDRQQTALKDRIEALELEVIAAKAASNSGLLFEGPESE